MTFDGFKSSIFDKNLAPAKYGGSTAPGSATLLYPIPVATMKIKSHQSNAFIKSTAYLLSYKSVLQVKCVLTV